MAAEEAAVNAGLDPLLFVQLVLKPRASQLNGCAFSALRMHARDAIDKGDTANGWPSSQPVESQYFTPQEQAALTLAEQVTRIGELHTAAVPAVDIEAVLDEKQVAAVVGIALVDQHLEPDRDHQPLPGRALGSSPRKGAVKRRHTPGVVCGHGRAPGAAEGACVDDLRRAG